MKRVGLIILALVAVFAAGFGIRGTKRFEAGIKSQTVVFDKYVAFVLETYDQIKENYWEKISDDELSRTYLLAVDKLSGAAHTLKSHDKKGVEILITAVLKDIKDDKKKEFSVSLVDTVLVNLKPFGRSRLYSQKEAKELSNTVSNIDPSSDLFKTLGVGKNANDQEISRAFSEKSKEATTEAQKAEVKRAYEALGDNESRKLYAVSGVEPTIEYKLINPSIFYVHLTKFSPTTMEEFARVTEKVDVGDSLDTLIFDLRENIGGAIDGLPYFLGPFIGPDTYGYQFYHQGEKEDFKTVTGWMKSLVRYNKVIVLIDGNTQSTAEVMASTLKKYNVGIILGATTKGWGTVEKVFPIKNQIADGEMFSLFLVHRVTLREDGQPIEGRGVEPQINIKNPNWKVELLKKYNFPGIVKAIEEIK
ncbi:hypothetical protein HYU91_04375 [Candidatus Collierbacteria bacterium]|nr:hypothetical protein [Candidatus Collierbacteria bacterium]